MLREVIRIVVCVNKLSGTLDNLVIAYNLRILLAANNHLKYGSFVGESYIHISIREKTIQSQFICLQPLHSLSI